MLFDTQAYRNMTSTILNEVESLNEYDKEQIGKILITTMGTKPLKEAYVCGVLISIIDGTLPITTLETFSFTQARYAYDVLSTSVDCIQMVL